MQDSLELTVDGGHAVPVFGDYMKTSAFVRSLILLCFCASISMAGTVAVTTSASFTGGLTNSWSFGYIAGAPDLFLQSITLDLSPTDLKFDTAAGGFGWGSYKDIGGFGGTDGTTGLSGISATGVNLDGGTSVTFTFGNFSPGSFFRFSADVDHDPVLVTCKPSDWACKATKTAINAARLAAAPLVGPNGIVNAPVTFLFGGINYNTASVEAAFQPLTLGDMINGISRGDGAGAFDAKAVTSADVTTPEPACVATFGAGLGLLIALSRRRRRA